MRNVDPRYNKKYRRKKKEKQIKVWKRLRDKLWRGACGKYCYQFPGQAKAALKNTVHSGKKNTVMVPGAVFNVYWCTVCGAYHLGHSVPKKRRQFRQAERLAS